MLKSNNNYATKEDLYKKLELINFWISNIDSKISFALAFAGVFIGFIISKGTPTILGDTANVPLKDIINLNFGELFSIILIIVLYSSALFSLILLLIALKGRINNNLYKEYKLNTKSLLFFGNIANMNYAEYKKKTEKTNNILLTNDINSQVYINSNICTYKFRLYNLSINFIIFSVITFCICIIFNIL